MLRAVLEAVSAVLGLLVGSYLGVLADRIPAGEPTAVGRSHCDSCDATLRWFELIPVISWVAQRGRCRRCGARIPVLSTVLELATAGLFAALAARFGMHWQLGGFLVMGAGLLLLSVIDLQTQKLPRRVMYVMTTLAVPFLVVGAVRMHQPVRLEWALFGCLGGLGFFLILYFGWRGSMGDGDVRLAAMLGLFLGWIGPMHTPVGLFLGFLAGAIVGSIRISRGHGLKSKLAFGPYLALGAVVTIFVGHPLIRLWLHR